MIVKPQCSRKWELHGWCYTELRCCEKPLKNIIPTRCVRSQAPVVDRPKKSLDILKTD